VEVVDGSGRPPPRGAPGNWQRQRPGAPAPTVVFGPRGELTAETIAAADLNADELPRAYEALDVQTAYLAILDALEYVVGPDGIFHSLAAITPTKLAVAFHLAKCGFRQTGPIYVARADLAPPPPAFGGQPQPGEGWHSPPKVTYETVERDP
jgi:hypothetical protein